MAEVVEIHKIFNSSKGKVAFQLPSDATQFGWQHTSRFYKTEQILRDGPISELQVEADPSIPGVTFKNAKGETETVRSHLEHFPVDALIVVKGGKVAFEHYKTMRPIDKHIWFSASKITGSTIMALLEHEGKIDVQKPVTDYLTELEGSAWETVKVEEVLDMATGLNGTEHDEGTGDERTLRSVSLALFRRWVSGKVISDRGRVDGDLPVHQNLATGVSYGRRVGKR